MELWKIAGGILMVVWIVSQFMLQYRMYKLHRQISEMRAWVHQYLEAVVQEEETTMNQEKVNQRAVREAAQNQIITAVLQEYFT